MHSVNQNKSLVLTCLFIIAVRYSLWVNRTLLADKTKRRDFLSYNVEATAAAGA